ncbi:MAG: RlmE family RNA methyltransferase [Aestuariivita sp.]|nr:RlmE family RNA methyltransferase [Aestuariivita sp.]
MFDRIKSKNKSGRNYRKLKQKIKTARGRKISSTRWLQRQLNDPYVKQAQAEGFRGRAAYKIAELDDNYGFFFPGAKVVDLGCAPGGWCQVALIRTNALNKNPNAAIGRIVGIDLQEVEPINGVELYRMNFLEENSHKKILNILNDKVDVVMSDMATAASGHKKTDHLRIMALSEAAANFAFDVLRQNGVFISKVLAGGAEGKLQKILKENFQRVKNTKPASSRKDSSEKFVVAIGFRGKSY